MPDSIFSKICFRFWIIPFCCFFFITVSGLTQTKTNGYAKSDYFSNFNPSSPERSALGSFGNVPINYFTGLPEINLNLLTLPSRDLSLPLSVNYDASGVRVDDISGIVGLKWNLNAGGFVARQLNGLPDETQYGYWNIQNELNGETIDIAKWVSYSEKNSVDTEPDEFYAYLPGRTIKFFYKDNKPVPVPRQGVKIQHTISNSKINGFTITTEDGTVYTFGNDVNAIEERKVETLSIVANFAFDYKSDTYEYSENNNGGLIGEHAWFYLGNILEIYQATYSEKIFDAFNSKWYLISMKSPNEDVINFTYQKAGTIKYATQPIVTRKTPLLTKVNDFKYVVNYCAQHYDIGIASWCHDTRRNVTIEHKDWQTPAYALFSNQCPDYNFTCSTNYPASVSYNDTHLYLNPVSYGIDPEGIFINHSLITESVVRLDAIKSATGNTIKFYYSGREDLLNAVKCDRIELINMQNTVVKNIKFKYAVANANTSNNYMWLSEAFLISKIDGIGGTNFFAENSLAYTESDISNALSRKYVFEGMKLYNYRRLFLEEITETGSNNDEQLLYGFKYYSRNDLKRRLTPLQNIHGFLRNDFKPEEFKFNGVQKANILNAYDPSELRNTSNVSYLTGILTQIVYPTGGSTKFGFQNMNGPMLTSIQDIDENNKVINQKSISYVNGFVGSNVPQLVFYQANQVPDLNLSRSYKIMSSVPQNKSFRTINGVLNPKTKVTVYNGSSSTDHNGYEVHTFTLSKDVKVPIYSSPKDLDLSGNPIDNITSYEAFPFPKNNQTDHLSGMPLEHHVYDKSGRLIKSTINEYATNPYGYAPIATRGFVGGSFPFNGGTKYRYGRHTVSSDWIVLSKTTEKVFDQSENYSQTKSIDTETSYVYDKTYLHPTEKKIVSNGTTLITKYKYASHPDYNFTDQTPVNCNERFDYCQTGCSGYSDPMLREICRDECYNDLADCTDSEGVYASGEIAAIRLLRSTNQNSTLIEEQSIIQRGGISRLKTGVLKTYSVVNSSKVKPNKVYALNSPIDPATFVTSRASSDGALQFDSRMRLVHTYDTYDPNTGNLILQTAADGTKVKYEWDETLASAFLKSQIVNEGISQQQTSYQQIPLRGVTAIQDPNGIYKRFEYDQFGRLKLTRDNSNNIISRYRYHLVSSNSAESLTASISASGLTAGAVTRFTTPAESRPGSTTYMWNFGDGTSATNSSTSINKTYAAPGTYTVTLTKSNPEYGSASAQTTFIIYPPPQITICADGPVQADICRSITGADSYGTCTATANRYWNYATKLNASIQNGCGPAYTFVWEYKLTSSATWNKFGGNTQQVTSPVTAYNGVVTADVRCTVTDACGATAVSNLVRFNFFKTSTQCPY